MIAIDIIFGRLSQWLGGESSPVSQGERRVVLSIKPEYSSKILAGKKTVELRRRFPMSAKGMTAYIYSTSPQCAIVGTVEINAVDKLQTAEIWKQFGRVALIEKSDFDKYFADVDHGFVLSLVGVNPFHQQISLDVLRKKCNFIPPQSFFYATHDLQREIRYASPVIVSS